MKKLLNDPRNVVQELIEGFVLANEGSVRKHPRVNAVIPYFGYARQDRKDKPRVPISAKLVANVLSAAGTHRVYEDALAAFREVAPKGQPPGARP